MKHLFIVFVLIISQGLASCTAGRSMAQQASEIFPVQEATVLAEQMASKLGLTALQKSSVYTTLLNYFTQKKSLYDQLKNNALTQAAFNLAESKLNTDRNTALKAIMSNSSQLAALGQYFGIK